MIAECLVGMHSAFRSYLDGKIGLKELSNILTYGTLNMEYAREREAILGNEECNRFDLLHSKEGKSLVKEKMLKRGWDVSKEIENEKKIVFELFNAGLYWSRFAYFFADREDFVNLAREYALSLPYNNRMGFMGEFYVSCLLWKYCRGSREKRYFVDRTRWRAGSREDIDNILVDDGVYWIEVKNLDCSDWDYTEKSLRIKVLPKKLYDDEAILMRMAKERGKEFEFAKGVLFTSKVAESAKEYLRKRRIEVIEWGDQIKDLDFIDTLSDRINELSVVLNGS